MLLLLLNSRAVEVVAAISAAGLHKNNLWALDSLAVSAAVGLGFFAVSRQSQADAVSLDAYNICSSSTAPRRIPVS